MNYRLIIQQLTFYYKFNTQQNMLSRTTFIIAPIALLLTLSLIIVIPSVFSSAIQPDTVYNTLIYEISKDLSENIEFYNTKCDNWNNNYTINIEDMNNT